MIDNIEVSEIGNAAAPGAVTNASIQAAKNGVLADTIRFTAPGITFGGAELTSISYIDIYRNGDDTEPAVSFDSSTPGETIEWVDANPINGINTYQIMAINGSGVGPVVDLSVFVGTDIPVAVNISQAWEYRWKSSNIVECASIRRKPGLY